MPDLLDDSVTPAPSAAHAFSVLDDGSPLDDPFELTPVAAGDGPPFATLDDLWTLDPTTGAAVLPDGVKVEGVAKPPRMHRRPDFKPTCPEALPFVRRLNGRLVPASRCKDGCPRERCRHEASKRRAGKALDLLRRIEAAYQTLTDSTDPLPLLSVVLTSTPSTARALRTEPDMLAFRADATRTAVDHVRAVYGLDDDEHVPVIAVFHPAGDGDREWRPHCHVLIALVVVRADGTLDALDPSTWTVATRDADALDAGHGAHEPALTDAWEAAQVAIVGHELRRVAGAYSRVHVEDMAPSGPAPGLIERELRAPRGWLHLSRVTKVSYSGALAKGFRGMLDDALDALLDDTLDGSPLDRNPYTSDRSGDLSDAPAHDGHDSMIDLVDEAAATGTGVVAAIESNPDNDERVTGIEYVVDLSPKALDAYIADGGTLTDAEQTWIAHREEPIDAREHGCACSTCRAVASIRARHGRAARLRWRYLLHLRNAAPKHAAWSAPAVAPLWDAVRGSDGRPDWNNEAHGPKGPRPRWNAYRSTLDELIDALDSEGLALMPHAGKVAARLRAWVAPRSFAMPDGSTDALLCFVTLRGEPSATHDDLVAHAAAKVTPVVAMAA